MTDWYKIKRVLTWVNNEEKQIYPAQTVQTFDFQNDWDLGWTLNKYWATNYNMSFVSWQWVETTVSNNNWWWHIIPPQSIYKWTLKRIRLWVYLWWWNTFTGISRVYDWSRWIALSYRYQNNTTTIWFRDWWSWTYDIWNYTWEMLIDVNFESWKITWTCAWQSFTITSSSADTMATYWTDKTLCLTAWWWWAGTTYIRKVEITSV